MKARSIDEGASPRSTSRASPMCTRTFFKPVGLDGVQHLDDAVLIGLAADEPDFRMMMRLPDKMLAAAKPDFEPASRPALCGIGGIESDVRKKVAHQRGLAFARLASAPPAV